MGLLVVIILMITYDFTIGLLFCCMCLLGVITNKLKDIYEQLQEISRQLKSIKAVAGSIGLMASTYSQFRIGQRISENRGDSKQEKPF